jgi:fatty acid desaturase
MTMEPNDRQNPPPRETMLTVILTGLAAGAFLLFLILVTGGFIFYVVLAVAAITALGFFHYLLWGYAMTQEVAQEQAQAERRPLAAGEEAWKENIQGQP